MIDCKSIAAEIKEQLKIKVDMNCGLAIIQVGENPASTIYVNNKMKDCEELGIPARLYGFDENTTTEFLIVKIHELNSDPAIKGIVVQLPLPPHIDTNYVLDSIADRKDIDGFKSSSNFIPATPKGILTVLHKTIGSLDSKNVTLIGRGKTVGEPLIPLLLKENATLTICHSHTKETDIRHSCRHANVIISAIGKPEWLTKQFLPLDPKAVIIDVGISRVNGKQVGDCAAELHDLVENITPWTNGIGLMTRVSLLQNLMGV